MATLSERVADLVGSVSEVSALSVWLNDGVIDVTKRSIMVNPMDAELFIAETDPLTANAQSVASSKIFTVVREDGTINQWRPCNKISAAKEYLAVDTGSIYLATKTNPVYFVDVNSTVNVFPTPSTDTGERFKVYYVNESPKGDGTADALAAGHTTIGYFPNDRVHLVVLYASLQELQRKMADNVFSITAVPPDVPSLTAITFGGPDSALDASTPTFTYTALAAANVYGTTSGFTTYYPLSDFGDSDPDAFTLNAVPPDVPTIDEVSYSPVTGDVVVTSIVFPSTTPNYAFTSTATDVGSLVINAVPPDTPTTSAQIVSFSEAKPDYTAPTFDPTDIAIGEYNVFSDGVTVTEVTAFSLSAVPPDVPDSPEFTLATVSPVPSLTSSETFADYLSSSPLGHNDPDAFVLLSVPPDVPVLESSSVSITGIAPEYAKPSQTFDMEQFRVFLEDEEDTELAQVQLGRLQQELGEYQADIQNELNEFNKENVEYQAKLQKDLRDADFDNQEDARALQQYQAEVQAYQIEVQAEVQEYTQKLSRYTQEINMSMQAWQKQESDKISSLQAEVAKYNADLQVQVQKAKLEQSDEYVQELSKFQAEVQEYQVEVTAEIQEFQQKLAEYQLELSNNVQVWNQRQSMRIQTYQAEVGEYNAKVQDSLHTFNSNNADYQAKLQVAIQNAQMEESDEARVLQRYSAEIQNYQAEVNTEVQEYGQNLQKYTQDLQKDLTNSLNEFNQENALFQAEVQEAVQNAQATNQVALKNIDVDLQDAVQTVQGVISNNSNVLQRFQNEISAYQAEVGSEVQEYTQKLGRYSTELGIVHQAWTQELQAAMQESMAELQAENQKNIAEGQAQLQRFTSDKDRELQRQLQDALNDAKTISDNNSQDMQLFQSEVGEYQAEVAAETQESTLKTQNYQTQYAWIKQQYEQGFVPFQQPQRQ